MKGEKEEKEIMKILTESNLNYWETLGMLESIKLQLHEIMMEELSKTK